MPLRAGDSTVQQVLFLLVQALAVLLAQVVSQVDQLGQRFLQEQELVPLQVC